MLVGQKDNFLVYRVLDHFIKCVADWILNKYCTPSKIKLA